VLFVAFAVFIFVDDAKVYFFFQHKQIFIQLFLKFFSMNKMLVAAHVIDTSKTGKFNQPL